MNRPTLAYPAVWLAFALPPMVAAFSMLFSMLRGETSCFVFDDCDRAIVTVLILHSLALASPYLGWTVGRVHLARALRRGGPDVWILTGCAPYWALRIAVCAAGGYPLLLFAYMFSGLVLRGLVVLFVGFEVWWWVLFIQQCRRVAVLEHVPSSKTGFVLHDLGVPKQVRARVRRRGPERRLVTTREKWGPSIVWQAVGPIEDLVTTVRTNHEPERGSQP